MNKASVEIEIGGHTLLVGVNWTHDDPGVTNGPPEKCYPPEPGEWEVESVSLPIGAAPPLDITRLVIELGGDYVVSEKSYEQFERDGGFDPEEEEGEES